MAINTNGADFTPGDPASVNQNREQHTNFSGAELGQDGPVGRLDFRQLTRRIGLARIDPTVEPYLDKVLELAKANMPSLTRIALERMNNAFAFRYEATDGSVCFYGIQFVTGRDPAGQNYLPKSQLLSGMQKELRDRDADKGRTIRVIDARIIVSGSPEEMRRTMEMANSIVSSFQVATVNELKNAQISAILGTEFVTNWNLAEAKQVERSLSPHAIAPRMELAMTLMAKLKPAYSTDQSGMDQEFEPLGVIGGFTEVREKELFTGVNGVREMRYQPIFHITTLNAVIPIPGIAAILMRAFAPAIFSSLTWVKQWRDLSDNSPHPGLLEADPDQRDRPVQFRDADELRDFINTKFATPYIAYDYLDGYDNIPGMARMVQDNSQSRQRFFQGVANFFGASTDNLPRTDVTTVVDLRFEGGMGQVDGQMIDSRNVDYLYLAAKNGVGSLSVEQRQMLMGNIKNPVERAKIASLAANGNFVPLYLSSVAIIDATFLNWVGEQCVTNGLRIVDPDSRPESRPLSSFVGGFGSNANMSSIVSSGMGGNRGVNVGSVWNYQG